MAMDKINGSPLLRQSAVDLFRSTERGGSGAESSAGVAGSAASGANADKADISAAARRLVDLKQAVDAGRQALAAIPDVRPDKVAAARERLATGFYHSVEVRQAVAERVAGVISNLDNL